MHTLYLCVNSLVHTSDGGRVWRRTGGRSIDEQQNILTPTKQKETMRKNGSEGRTAMTTRGDTYHTLPTLGFSPLPDPSFSRYLHRIGCLCHLVETHLTGFSMDLQCASLQGDWDTKIKATYLLQMYRSMCIGDSALVLGDLERATWSADGVTVTQSKG